MVTDIQISSQNPYFLLSISRDKNTPNFWNGVVYTINTTSRYTFYTLYSTCSLISDYLGLALTQDQIDKLKELEEEEFLESLKNSCKKVNTEFWYQTSENPKITEEKFCNLCKHYSLLNGFCTKLGVPKKSKDSCRDWEK